MLLETPRLRLRWFRPADAAALAAYRSDSSVARYQSWSPPVSVAAAAALIREFEAGSPGLPGWFQYAACTGCPPSATPATIAPPACWDGSASNARACGRSTPG